jgi:hypothetical protein
MVHYMNVSLNSLKYRKDRRLKRRKIIGKFNLIWVQNISNILLEK